MMAEDHEAIALLTHAAEALALANGPIGATTAAATLSAASTVIRTRGAPITMQTLDAIMALIEALRDEITS